MVDDRVRRLFEKLRQQLTVLATEVQALKQRLGQGVIDGGGHDDDRAANDR